MIDDAVRFEVLGRAIIDAVLRYAGQGVAGPKHQGKEGQWNQPAWEPERESGPF